jgi:uncharacterized protein
MDLETDLSLSCVLPSRLLSGPPGESVRALARELGIRRIRFRPVLPLGRARELEPDVPPETILGHVEPREMIEYGFYPTASCGMGQNLYVEPDGGAYPCYAWHGEMWLLGYINDARGLHGIVESEAFKDLGRHTVNTNHACRKCVLRYLCGGACRAWNRQEPDDQTDLDEPPLNCSHLQNRSIALLGGAMKCLGISRDKWLAAGLPRPGKESRPVLMVESG